MSLKISWSYCQNYLTCQNQTPDLSHYAITCPSLTLSSPSSLTFHFAGITCRSTPLLVVYPPPISPWSLNHWNTSPTSSVISSFRSLLPKASWKFSYSVSSISHASVIVTPTFSSIELHSSSLSSAAVFLDSTQHTHPEIDPPMHFSCSSYGNTVATRQLINQTLIPRSAQRSHCAAT